jgi:hypothetical protein
LLGSCQKALSRINDLGISAKSLVFFLVIIREIVYVIMDPGRTAETTSMPFCFLDLLLLIKGLDNFFGSNLI